MRTILLFSLLALAGCENADAPKVTQEVGNNVPGAVYTTTINDHRYIVWEHNTGYAGMGGICHDESCPCDTIQP
jgi:hypothetical protein